MLLHERQIEVVVERVLERLSSDEISVGSYGNLLQTRNVSGSCVYPTVSQAVGAAKEASREVARLPLRTRARIIDALRRAAIDNLEQMAKLAVEETGMGRVEDKINKNRLAAEKTPGIEALGPVAVTGDEGSTTTERGPYGLIGSIMPSTNPSETVINNGIAMFAAGNSVIFNPHPGAMRTSLFTIELFSRTVAANGGPLNTFVSVSRPTIETATAIMQHADVDLLVVTGAEGVVKAALKSGKKVIGAGPGNPPAVVDETADISKAANDIVRGASLDNNIVCIDEKVTVAVDGIASALTKEMEAVGAYVANPDEIRQLERLLFERPPQRSAHNQVVRKFIGKDANVILDAIGVHPGGDPRLILCEVPHDSAIAWTEMLMPVMPIVRVPDVDAAIRYAVAVEGKRGHTASMHSRNIVKLTEMAQAMNCSIFVMNGPNYAGIGLGGEGSASYTIATGTGDGVTGPKSFTRERRCTVVGSMRFV